MMIVVVNRVQRVDLAPGDEFQCGRLDNLAEGVIGLDPLDRAISRRALHIGHTDAGWTATNLSRSQTVHIERSAAGRLVPLPPGGVHVIDRQTTSIEVSGAIRTHRIDLLGESQVAKRDTTNHTPAGWEVDTEIDPIDLTEKERIALTAVFRGYLEPFPRRNCEPLSYAAAAASVGVSPTAVRRRVERVRSRLSRSGVYLEGPLAKQQLAGYLIERGALTPADLRRLEASR